MFLDIHVGTPVPRCHRHSAAEEAVTLANYLLFAYGGHAKSVHVIVVGARAGRAAFRCLTPRGRFQALPILPGLLARNRIGARRARPAQGGLGAAAANTRRRRASGTNSGNSYPRQSRGVAAAGRAGRQEPTPLRAALDPAFMYYLRLDAGARHSAHPRSAGSGADILSGSD